MSEKAIDVYRVVSVLGYCLLPMVGVGAVSVIVTLEYVFFSFDLAFPYSLFLQWSSWLYTLHPIYIVVYICSIWHFRGGVAYV